jgi:hypothetical protein
MRKRCARARFEEPSLVPLADMLTNTVGIVVFILIFTVLTAGGVVLAKRLPLERQTNAKPLHFFCAGNRVLPLRVDKLSDDFLDPLGRPTSFYAVDGWVRKVEARKIEDEYFVVTGKANTFYSSLGFGRSVSISLSLACEPKVGQGETAAELKQAGSRFRQMLTAAQTSGQFIHFFVRPDSLDVFESARNVATEINLGTGWRPMELDKPVRFGQSGRSAMEQ